ncbi:hypothetical protein KXD97_00265 [Mycobacterium sp. SMC-8]|uniref:hypothetical protein n=1 Tax=Mycobacterium sp. SMC-8 TaxID=2857060 RepID=UPI0021B44338|nr:hypothetical protein [Mycobacterium sp. SMC-8]UXA12392.1 hypothetical protein KXD97_00265 [Mycobacterium sp. SMC-8]
MSKVITDLDRELSKRFVLYPPRTWSPQLMRGMIHLLDAYGVLREAELGPEDTQPLLRAVK